LVLYPVLLLLAILARWHVVEVAVPILYICCLNNRPYGQLLAETVADSSVNML
jgi:hypothetical protein